MVVLLAAEPSAYGQGVVQVLLATLGVVQTIALAVIADRSRRVRADDRRAARRRATGGPHTRRASDSTD